MNVEVSKIQFYTWTTSSNHKLTFRKLWIPIHILCLWTLNHRYIVKYKLKNGLSFLEITIGLARISKSISLSSLKLVATTFTMSSTLFHIVHKSFTGQSMAYILVSSNLWMKIWRWEENKCLALFIGEVLFYFPCPHI